MTPVKGCNILGQFLNFVCWKMDEKIEFDKSYVNNIQIR